MVRAAVGITHIHATIQPATAARARIQGETSMGSKRDRGGASRQAVDGRSIARRAAFME